MALLDDVRAACARVAARSEAVRIVDEALPDYAAALPPARPPDPGVLELPGADRGTQAAFVLTLDAINFGSGWFPTLRKRGSLSGFNTVATSLREHFLASGAWSPEELERLDGTEVAAIVGQEPGHELMGLYAGSLNALGTSVRERHGGDWLKLVDAAGPSAERLVEELASWPSFRDVSSYGGEPVPLFKRAQITASDLSMAGVAAFSDLHRLTAFADNLVPHVLRLDGVLVFGQGLVDRIEAQELIEHGSAQEVEIRACAVHAIELLAARRDDLTASAIDGVLWHRGSGKSYKERPRHRSRCTAY